MKKTPIIVSEKDRLAIIIRIQGDEGLSAEAVQVLRLLRLNATNRAVFVRVSSVRILKTFLHHL